ncbi:MAG: gluconokinase, partial [Saprospiraceae bacterium]|nr:gluconokinase [Saprospiraceae bacterium]
MNYLIAIDIGTSSTRSVAFSTEGQLLCSKSVSYPIQSPQPGWQEQDPQSILDAVIKTVQKVVKSVGAAPIGISLSAAMHSLLAVDEQGEVLTPCIIWADNRSVEYAEELKNTELGKAIYRHTGTPIHPMSPLCKIAWLRDKQPEIFSKAYKFVGIKEYVLFHLFGQWRVDYSIASAMGMFDKQTLDWYAPALELAGITAARLPELVPPVFVLNPLKAEAAEELGLDSQTPFVIGASDGCLANLGALALEKGETVITLGTSAAIRMTTQASTYDEQERIFNYLLVEDLYIAGGASNNGGIVFQWFAEAFLRIDSKEKAFKSIKKIRKIPAGSEGLLFLPYLTGERAPVWDSKSKGVFFGVTKNHNKLHFQRAVLEGIFLNVLQIGKALEETVGSMETIYVNGGLAQIDILVQMLADIFGKAIHIQENEEGSAFGAFLMGMKALGLLGDFAEAKNMIRIQKTYMPDAVN